MAVGDCSLRCIVPLSDKALEANLHIGRPQFQRISSVQSEAVTDIPELCRAMFKQVLLLLTVFPLFFSFKLEECELIDMTHEFKENSTIYWPTALAYDFEIVNRGVNGGFYYELNNIAAAEHGGTHLDAPAHFSKGAQRVNQVPFTSLIGEACVLNLTAQSSLNRDYLFAVEDVLEWEAENGQVNGCMLLFMTGFEFYWPDKLLYLGTDTKNTSLLHFPGVDPSLAAFLTTNRSVKAVGLDTASIDYGQSTTFDSHQVFGAANVPVLENLYNLHRLPARGSTLLAIPMLIWDGSGAPVRALAYGWNGEKDPCRR